MEQINWILASTGLGAGILIPLAVWIIIKRAGRSKDMQLQYDPKSTTFVFSGNLRQTSLLEAIQFLELGRREGVLHIYCGRRKGYITFFKGKVIDSFYRNFTGREAVLQMFDIDEGDFYFEPKPVSQPQLINESILDLTFEWDSRRTGEGR